MTVHPITDAPVAGVGFREARARALSVVGDSVTPVIDAPLGAGHVEVFDVTGPEGSGPPPHSHPWDEAYYVLDGALAVLDWTPGLENPIEKVLHTGGSAHIPGDTTHSFQVRSGSCRFMIITTPGAHAFFADVDTTLGGNTEDLDTLIAVAQRNQLQSPLFPPKE